jgi:hypothetical protein
VTSSDADVFLTTDAFYVETGHSACLNLFILKNCDLLLGVVKKSDTPIGTANCYEIFQSRYRVWHSLGHLDVTVEPVGDLLEQFHMHKLAFRLFSIRSFEL